MIQRCTYLDLGMFFSHDTCSCLESMPEKIIKSSVRSIEAGNQTLVPIRGECGRRCKMCCMDKGLCTVAHLHAAARLTTST